MSKALAIAAFLLAAGGAWLWLSRSALAERARSGAALAIEPPEPPGPERIARARKLRGEAIAARCREAGLSYPPAELFLRAFKREAELEVWGRGAGTPWRRIAAYPVLAASGGAGPKRREGDRQVPEGAYWIDHWNAESRFRLSMRVDYPNASDRVRSDAQRPGGDIFIHGKRVSIGCLAMGDEAIDEMFLLTLDVRDRGQARIPIHLFPARMQGAEWETLRAAHPALAAFWAELQPIHDAFEQAKRVPEVRVAEDGRYVVEP